MKKIFSICLVIILSCLCLTGCGNSDELQEKRNEMQISNKKTEGVIEAYQENMRFISENADVIWNSLFYEEGEIDDSLFYNAEEDLDIYILNQRIVKRCLKYELDIDTVRNETLCYNFMNESNGSVISYYRIPLGYDVIYIEMTIQNGLIYTIEFEML